MGGRDLIYLNNFMKKPVKKQTKKDVQKDVQIEITKCFKKYIVKRPNGNCQVLFALTELDNLVDEIIDCFLI